MRKVLHVIHVEDCREDSELVKVMLESTGMECQIHRVEVRTQLLEALQHPCDLILSDCTLPQFHGLEALEVARATRPDVPFIFISGTIGEETAIKSLQNGATDYVLKQRISRLIPAVRRALSDVEARKNRHALEQQLIQARKLETIGTLIGGIAHDFRNLLQIQKLSIDLLGMVAHEPDQVLQIAAKLDQTTERGTAMMQELLTFARKTETNLLPVDMCAQIRETTQMIQASLPANVTLSLELENELPPVMGDRSQLDRIFTNLIVNARDALSQGGEIAISTDVIQFDQAHLNSWQMNDTPYLRIQVSDNGSGIDPATQARIFEPFFTTKPEGAGTGLGLSVVYGLVETHQGFIDLDSKVGEGTTFSLFFPLLAGASVAAERIQVISPLRLLGQPAPNENTVCRAAANHADPVEFDSFDEIQVG